MMSPIQARGRKMFVINSLFILLCMCVGIVALATMPMHARKMMLAAHAAYRNDMREGVIPQHLTSRIERWDAILRNSPRSKPHAFELQIARIGMRYALHSADSFSAILDEGFTLTNESPNYCDDARLIGISLLSDGHIEQTERMLFWTMNAERRESPETWILLGYCHLFKRSWPTSRNRFSHAARLARELGDGTSFCEASTMMAAIDIGEGRTRESLHDMFDTRKVLLSIDHSRWVAWGSDPYPLMVIARAFECDDEASLWGLYIRLNLLCGSEHDVYTHSWNRKALEHIWGRTK